MKIHTIASLEALDFNRVEDLLALNEFAVTKFDELVDELAENPGIEVG